VGDVTADCYYQPGEPALVAANGQRIQERLGWMLVRTIAGINDRALDLLSQESDSPGGVMAHDEEIRAHGVQRHGRVDQRLALLHS
jgi:hypothetical protein